MTQEKNWEQKMHQQRKLRKKGSELLFDRVRLLIECYEDKGYREWHRENGTDEIEYLDEELSDVAASFQTLRAVYEAYPDRESWVKHNIRDLMAEAIAKSRQPKERTKPSWKAKCMDLQKENEQLRAELASLKEILTSCVAAKG